MANIDDAIDSVLAWEDPGLTGLVTTSPAGYRTRFGIDERFHPGLTNCLFYGSMGSTAAVAVAKGVYRKEYCQPLCIAEIVDQQIANKLLSLGVNIGVVPAAKMLQDALSVEGDGRIGPLTLGALDLANPQKVLDDLRREAELYYECLVERDPRLEMYLKGWERRAEA